jgi:DNA-binding NtrC family response regulator
MRKTHPAHDRSAASATILLLNSETTVRAVLTELLERAGYVVLATGDLGKAVDRLAECSPDLLIISPYVEDMAGQEAAKYLHARNPRMAVLMLTGFVNDDRLRYRADLEDFEIFPPPVTGAQLLEKIASILKRVSEQEVQYGP